MQQTRGTVFQAFDDGIAAVPLAAGPRYPLTGHLLSPMVRAAPMAPSSIIVVLGAALPGCFRAPVLAGSQTADQGGTASLPAPTSTR